MHLPLPIFKIAYWSLAILSAITLIFWFTPLDIAALDIFFAPGKCWCMADGGVWKFLYHFGIYLGYVLALAALVILTLSFWRPKNFIQWRKPAFFLIFCMTLGPGIIINAVLKEQWKRARPRDVVEFGGKEAYTPPVAFGNATDGKSFPCGHCSMGFYLGLPFLFLIYTHKRWAYFFLSLGVLSGGMLGLTRMMAGGHFLSDALWAGGIVWLVGLLGHRLFGLDKPLVYLQLNGEDERKKAKWVTLAVGILLPVLTLGILLATPYISSKKWSKTVEELTNMPQSVVAITFEEGNVDIKNGSDLELSYAVQAFGLPNSKMGVDWTTKADTIFLTIAKRGWFTEVRNSIQLTLPNLPRKTVLFKQKKGNVFVHLDDTLAYQASYFTLNSGDVHVINTHKVGIDLYYKSQQVDIKYPQNYMKDVLKISSYTLPVNEIHVVIESGILLVE